VIVNHYKQTKFVYNLNIISFVKKWPYVDCPK